MRTVGVGVLLLSLLLAFSACEEQQAGHAGSEDCARHDPEDVHHAEQSGSQSPISIVLSEIRALRDEIENTLLHVEKRSLQVAGVLCGLTILVLAIGVLVVYCREQAQDRVHYVAIQRAQSNLLTEFKQRIQSQTNLLGSKARLLRNSSQSSLLSGSDGLSDSEPSSSKAKLPKIHSMPAFLGKGDWEGKGRCDSSARGTSSSLATNEGASGGVEESMSALQTLKHACQFTIGCSNSDVSLKDSLGPSQSSESSKHLEKENSAGAEGKRDMGNGEDSAEERGGKAVPKLRSPETIGQLSRSSAEDKHIED